MTTSAKVLIRIGEEKFWHVINERHGARGGVYRIVAVEQGHRIPVNRFLGTDKEGVLYIGKAISFLERVIALKKVYSARLSGKFPYLWKAV